MRVFWTFGFIALVLAILLFSLAPSPEPELAAVERPSTSLPIDSIRLPEGFRIDVFAEGVENARSMARAPDGTIFVGTRTAGRVYALRDTDGNGFADRRWTIASGLNMPNGIDFRGGALYVAEIHRILRYDEILSRLSNPPQPVIVKGDLPRERHHGWRFMRFGPDGKLYCAIGAPCNVCEPSNPIFATIIRMNVDGSGAEVYASGIRNSVGFAWAPDDGALWFTDNGRDLMGDDVPPDELNRAPRPGLHFGFPYEHGDGIRDPEFGRRAADRKLVRPVRALGPHVASLGLVFHSGKMFGAPYRGQVFIAEHGSWNRSTKIGYRISLVRRNGARTVSYETFADGWMRDGRVWGRPVDLLELPDGSLLVSDDHAGAIYRISRRG